MLNFAFWYFCNIIEFLFMQVKNELNFFVNDSSDNGEVDCNNDKESRSSHSSDHHNHRSSHEHHRSHRSSNKR